MCSKAWIAILFQCYKFLFLMIIGFANASGKDSQCLDYDGKVILAFGDSLTHGSGAPARRPHPYAIKLKELMPSTRIIELGIPGEVTPTMMERLKITLQQMKELPTVVVILGGTNDIGRGLPTGTTISNIINMHEDIRLLKSRNPEKYGGIKHTVLMTIPRMTFDRFRKSRIEINHELRNYVARSSSDDGFTLLMDIENVFSFSPCTSSAPNDGCKPDAFNITNKRYWDAASPLHFSPEGYDEIGKMIYATLCEGKSVFA
jgi:lysophospholipase L1-like esterase